jgi:hypothetical protein
LGAKIKPPGCNHGAIGGQFTHDLPLIEAHYRTGAVFTPKLKLIGGVAVLSVAIAGCSQLAESLSAVLGVETESRIEGDAASTLLADNRNRFQIEIPAGWEDAAGDLHSDAEIQAANRNESLYVIVLAEDSTTRLNTFDLSENASIYRRFIVDGLSSISASISTEVTTIDEHDAVQYEISGTLDGSPVTYLHTTIRSDNRYYQVLAWTDQARYDDSLRQRFQEITDSLTELQ